jgi:Delta3-Delta2-enoyl-CoA isomerase
MRFIEAGKSDRIATARLSRGKVNALNGVVVDELRSVLQTWERDPEVLAVVVTGAGKFFSFGFDIPEFLSFTRTQFTDYLVNFTNLYTSLFLYPKPVVAALNGHAIAGGCMLALACDHRVMASGKARISLNEISFGSSVFAGSTEMLRFWVGSAKATTVLVSGDMYSAEEAKSLGLVQDVVPEEGVAERASQVAAALATKHAPAFASVKSLLRRGVVEEMKSREPEAVRDFVDIWYSDATWANLQNIRIR